MSDFGVQPTGYVVKPLATILADLEALMITQFGPGVIQTAASPLGQLNGLAADIVTEVYELGQDNYASYDPDQAEGTRLDILAKLRLVGRGVGESDVSLRAAITNAGRARVDIQDFQRALIGLDGVTYAYVFTNDTDTVDENTTLPSGNIAIAVLGGADDDIAAVARRFIVPGISTYGNARVSSNIDGFCRTFLLIRPTLVPTKVTITVRRGNDKLGCPPVSLEAIQTAAFNSFAGLINGEDITLFRVRQPIESGWSNIEVLSFHGERDTVVFFENQTVNFGFFEMATVAFDDITIVDNA